MLYKNMDKLNFEKDYLKNGYVISKSILDEGDINTLRFDLEKEFEGVNKYSIYLHEFKNIELVKKIINFYKDNKIKAIQSDLQKINNSRVSILPPFEVHRNYHVNLKEVHGWHRDCGGELKYSYCKDILYDQKYLFSKVGIYLQKNSEYGGCIDVIKTSHKNFSNLKIFLRKIRSIPLRIITLLHKYLNKIYYLMPESFFMSFLNAKRLYPEKGSAIFFDSRIIHRGSPISKKEFNKIQFSKGQYHAILPKEYDKYSIYCHFGSTSAIDSYMYDRLKRSNNSHELNLWIDQIKFISKFDEKLGKKMSEIIEPVLRKYSSRL